MTDVSTTTIGFAGAALVAAVLAVAFVVYLRNRRK
jgi:hypothetical protein